MKYEDMKCGMRVTTGEGRGVVESYDAKVPSLRALFDGLAVSRIPPKATVLLDNGVRVRDFILNLTTEKEEA